MPVREWDQIQALLWEAAMEPADKVEVLFVNYDPLSVDSRYLSQAASQVTERVPSIAIIVLCPRARGDTYKPLEFHLVDPVVMEELKRLLKYEGVSKGIRTYFSPDKLIAEASHRAASPPSMPDLGPMKYGNIINKSLGYAADKVMEAVPPVNPVLMKQDSYLKACADPNRRFGALRIVIDNGTRYVFDLGWSHMLASPPLTADMLSLDRVKEEIRVRCEQDGNPFSYHDLKLDLTTTKVEIDRFEPTGRWETVKVL